MSIVTQLISTLRQFLQPAEFRIPSPVWPPEWEASLQEALNPSPVAPSTADVAIVNHQRAEREQQKLLADLATNLWRLRSRMLEPGTTTPKEASRREYRHVEALWDALAGAGVEVRDPTGMKFDVGLSLKVLAYQPTPGVTQERVQETLKPGVYLRGHPIQMGEVIVETPAGTPSEKPAPASSKEAPPEPEPEREPAAEVSPDAASEEKKPPAADSGTKRAP